MKVYYEYGVARNLSKESILEIFEAMIDGAGVECKQHYTDEWQPCDTKNFTLDEQMCYRTVWDTPTIDWSQVSSEFCYLARDRNGTANLFTHHPSWSENFGMWKAINGVMIDARIFGSYNAGNAPGSLAIFSRP